MPRNPGLEDTTPLGLADKRGCWFHAPAFYRAEHPSGINAGRRKTPQMRSSLQPAKIVCCYGNYRVVIICPVKQPNPHPGPHYQALLQLLRTAEALWNASRTFFARWDLSPSQFNLLNLLTDHPDGRSQTELSRELITHRSNVTGLVDRLEQRGLVTRRDVDTDRRAYRIVLTPAGTALLRQILPHYYRAAEQAWGEVSPRRAAQIVADLATVTEAAARLAEQPLPNNK